MRAGFRLGQAAEREAQIIDLFLRGGERKKPWSLSVSTGRKRGGDARRIDMAANIVAGRQRIGAKIARVCNRSANLTVWLQDTQGIGVSPLT